MNKKKVTLDDIDQELNLSINTVSRALRDCYDISEGTKEIVRMKALELNYSFRKPVSDYNYDQRKLVIIVFNSFLNPYYSIMAEKLIKRLKDKYLLSVFPSSSYELEYSLIKHAYEYKTAAIISFLEPNEKTENFIHNNGIPLIILGRECQEKSLDDIFTDDFNGGEIVAKHFFDLGIDKIAYIGPDNVECSLRRYEGLKSKWKELTNKNVPFINCFSELKSVLNELVSSAYISGIRGLFCFNDVTAYKVYKAKQTDNKYHDLSIVGFDNLHSQREYLPDISSIGYDYNELADLVSVTLDARLRKQGNIKTMKVKLPVFLYKKD